MTKSIETALLRRKAIWEAMGETQYPKTRPLLSLEQFFLHSEKAADLWYNVTPYPDEINQYDFHCSIRARPDVWDILISITQMDEEPNHDLASFTKKGYLEWPNSDHTLIITSADEVAIRSWFPKGIQPDEINIGDWSESEWGVPSFIPSGFQQAWLWYD